MTKFLSLLFLCIFIGCFSQSPQDLLAKANESYEEGVKAKTVGERKRSLNQALNLYQEIKQSYPSPLYSGQLDGAIANTYYELGAYPWAILYDYRALHIEPQNRMIRENLKRAQDQLGISSEEKMNLEQILSFNYFFSFPKRLEVFLWLGLLTLLLSFLAIRLSFTFLNRITFVFVFLTLLLSLDILLSFYLTPIEGILIKPTGIYREAQFQQSQLQSTPLKEGLKIEVLGEQENGDWLKIKTADGTIGYIPAPTLRII